MKSALKTLASMLGVRSDLAEGAMHSERAAKAVLSRRNLFAAAGAMAAGSVFMPVSAPTLAHEFIGGFTMQLSVEEMAGGAWSTTWVHKLDPEQSITITGAP